MPKMIRMEAKLKGLEGKAVKVKQDHPTFSIPATMRWQISRERSMKSTPWIHKSANGFSTHHPPTIYQLIPAMLVHDNWQVQRPNGIWDAAGKVVLEAV